MAERKKRSWRVWAVLRDSDGEMVGAPPSWYTRKNAKQSGYCQPGEHLARATLTLDAPLHPRRKTKRKTK